MKPLLVTPPVGFHSALPSTTNSVVGWVFKSKVAVPARAEAIESSPRTKLLKRMLRIRCPLRFGCVCPGILNVQLLTTQEYSRGSQTFCLGGNVQYIGN